MKLSWEIRSRQKDIPPHGELNSLEEVKQFLTANGISVRNDRGWTVRELEGGVQIAQCQAGILLSAQAAGAKTILELTVSG